MKAPKRLSRRGAGLAVGAIAFLVILAAPTPSGLSADGWRTVAATALLPLLLFPLLGIAPIKATAVPYAHPLIFLFLGGFLIALTMQRWNLHRRIALGIVGAAGSRPHALVVGFMAATALLSMWVSNTATTMMLLPVAVSVIAVVVSAETDGAPTRHGRNFSLCLMLGIAYAASIGGLGTLVGTPPNALLAAFLADTYGLRIGFAEWMVIGLPLVALMLPVAWFVLTRLTYPFALDADASAAEAIAEGRRDLGPLSRPEKRVAAVFALVALAWMLRPWLTGLPGIGGLTDTGIAVMGALALFFLPAGDARPGPLARWEDARDLPWGVLILFGGELSLAGAFAKTGLAAWLGGAVEAAGAGPAWVFILAAVALIIFLTELTSNTATTAAFLPVLGLVAAGAGIAPLQLTVPAAVAASCAFMLPVATPPNAIVFASGHVTIGQMMRAGFVLNLAGVVVITLFADLVLPLVPWMGR